MVSTRRSSFSVPALPSSSRKPPRSSRITNVRVEAPNPPSLPPRPPKPPIQRPISTPYFLHDINLDGDLLSIPDPPSPSKRHRRRLSSPLQDLTNSGTRSSTISDDYSNQIRKRQCIDHVPSPRVVSHPRANHALTNHLDLSGASFLRDHESEKIVRRHSLASLPSPMTTAEGPSTCALDLSGAMDFSNFEAEPRNDHGVIPSPVLVTAHDVEAEDLNGAPESVPSCTHRRRCSFTLDPNTIPSTTEAIAKSFEFGETTSSRPPRPETLSQRRKKRQSFFLPKAFHVNEDDKDRPESKHDFSGVGDCSVSGPAEADQGSPKRVNFLSKEQESSFVDNAEDSLPRHARSLDIVVGMSPSAQESASKRRKKRQSIFLPSDSKNDQPGEVAEFFDTLMKAAKQPQEDQMSPKPTIESHTIVESVADEMTTIRRLVREYCSLPEGERGSSDAAKKIEELTSYPLVSTPDQACDGSSQGLFERRHALLVKLGPIVERMERGKIAEKDLCERETGFRVERSRSGRYRYFNSETNTRVSPNEYEEVYLKQLQKASKEKGLVIQHFLRNFDKSVHNCRIEESESVVTFDYSQIVLPSNIATNDINLTETVGIKNVSCEMVDDDGMDISESPSPRVTASHVPSHDVGEDNILVEKVTVTPDQHVLALPPREEVPTDPEIAKAHHMLWRTIDHALETYSRSVLAIQTSKISSNSERA